MPYERNSFSISTQSHFIKNNTFRKHKHVSFGGNRKDPLNLNELIRQKNQSITNNNHTDMNSHGNDRLVEILLQPNIHDPLCLDISSHSNESSIDITSVNQHSTIQTTQRNFQPMRHNQFYDQQVPETKQYNSIKRY
ncbi:unnamed protein product [Rotaria sp. Silwood1]|nr:unnamed protein product [Rotaria sp. Silwood1]CAF0999491.1 unnamed protein product [Rotaria sp. Silwood1]CAF3420415.1 unnamed protein product [Rotaria sp. Silwood1]CAF4496017.1 unnamed protein product [Rotaria sp. Silwood1]